MFNEIVINGNIIVMSNNQIVDSSIFMEFNRMEMDESYGNTQTEDGKKRTVLDFVMDLIDAGYIRYTTYNMTKSPSNIAQIRTPSQFIQNKLEKTDAEYYFSSMKWLNYDDSDSDEINSARKQMRADILNALRYTDLNRVYEFRNKYHNFFSDDEIDYVDKYVRLVLKLSGIKSPFKSVDVESMTGLIERLNANTSKIDDKNISEAIIETFNYMKRLDTDSRNSGDLPSNYRSNWYPALDNDSELSITTQIDIRKVIDICYNYSIELGIEGIQTSFMNNDDDSLIRDFITRFYNTNSTKTLSSQEWKLFSRVINVYSKNVQIDSIHTRDEWLTSIRKSIKWKLWKPLLYLVLLGVIFFVTRWMNLMTDSQGISLIVIVAILMPDAISLISDRILKKTLGLDGLIVCLLEVFHIMGDLHTISRYGK